jgi:hypothetical protein
VAEPASPGDAKGPDILLVGWNVLELDAAASAQLAGVAMAFEPFRKACEFDFPWLGIWRLSSEDIDTLRSRLTLQLPKLAALFLQKSTTQVFQLCPDTAQVRMTEAEPSQKEHFGAAQAELVANLVAGVGDRNRAREAQLLYEYLVQRDLVRPLQDWALASSDPVIRNAGVELANVCSLLHKLSPGLQSCVAEWLRSGRQPDDGSPDRLLRSYLRLTGQFATLVKTLSLLCNQPRAARGRGRHDDHSL